MLLLLHTEVGLWSHHQVYTQLAVSNFFLLVSCCFCLSEVQKRLEKLDSDLVKLKQERQERRRPRHIRNSAFGEFSPRYSADRLEDLQLMTDIARLEGRLKSLEKTFCNSPASHQWRDVVVLSSSLPLHLDPYVLWC